MPKFVGKATRMRRQTANPSTGEPMSAVGRGMQTFLNITNRVADSINSKVPDRAGGRGRSHGPTKGRGRSIYRGRGE